MKIFLIASVVLSTLVAGQAFAANSKTVESKAVVKAADSKFVVEKPEVKEKPEAKSKHASAISENFEGISASLGLGVVGSNSSFKYYGSDAAGSDYELGKNGASAVTNLSYLRAISDKWLIGGGVSYDLNSLHGGSSNNNSIGTGSLAAKATSKHHFSIYVQPTYALNEKIALFAKAGYHSTRVTILDNGQLYSSFQGYSKKLYGLGYGGGLITFLDKNVFLKAEIEFVNYNRVRIPYEPGSGRLTYKLSTVAGIMSIGYRF